MTNWQRDELAFRLAGLMKLYGPTDDTEVLITSSPVPRYYTRLSPEDLEWLEGLKISF